MTDIFNLGLRSEVTVLFLCEVFPIKFHMFQDIPFTCTVVTSNSYLGEVVFPTFFSISHEPHPELNLIP